MSEFNTEDLDEVIASTNGSLVQMLALQLKNELAKITALTSQLESVVAENAALKSAFDNPDAWLSWHAIPPTWEDPLPCGEYLDVHDTDGHKNSDGTDCWPVFARPEIETISTDAFLAEVRASAIPSDVMAAIKKVARIRLDLNGFDGDKRGIIDCLCEAEESLIEAVNKFAAQLRQGGAV